MTGEVPARPLLLYWADSSDAFEPKPTSRDKIRQTYAAKVGLLCGQRGENAEHQLHPARLHAGPVSKTNAKIPHNLKPR